MTPTQKKPAANCATITRHGAGGFSLVELTILLAVMLILAGFTVPTATAAKFSPLRSRSADRMSHDQLPGKWGQVLGKGREGKEAGRPRLPGFGV